MPTIQNSHTSSIQITKLAQLRDFVRCIPWLSPLTDEDINHLLFNSEVRKFDNGAWLYRQNSPSRTLFLIIDGIVRLERTAQNGQTATIRFAGRGEPLGELGLVSMGGLYQCSAETLRRTHVLSISTEAGRVILNRQPACRTELLSYLTTELTNRLEEIVLRTQTSPMTRLISYILRQRPINNKGSQWIFLLTFPKRWLADQLVMTPETLSRKLLVLRECGAIQVSSYTIKVISEKKLHEILLQED